MVIALGGNALVRRGTALTFENQLKAAKECSPGLSKLISSFSECVLTHGNGPQVGQLAVERCEAPLDLLVAETQGQIGHALSLALDDSHPGIGSAVVFTQVLVDRGDTAFHRYTKFVGPPLNFLDEAKRDWVVRHDGSSFRRVVPSPFCMH